MLSFEFGKVWTIFANIRKLRTKNVKFVKLRVKSIKLFF